MEKELDSLHTRLFKAKKRAERITAVLICGGPGSGKSHLARQYVWTQRKNYPGGIFWVDAKSRQSTFKCFWDIAQAATLTDGKEFDDPDSRAAQRYVDAVRNWFQAREEWLLIFDGLIFNHDEDLNYFRQFLPFNKRCSIIYTSVDKTLRKKQRLFEPYCLKVSPLQVEDACKLLFKDLAIKRPTADQTRKAMELVKHYECLPLAIHAISHRLSATSKPIEKYHINSHLTDEKLAEPFLGIMHDLYRMEHYEALNLINLLSFFGHHVPVGLLSLGRPALEACNVPILTSSRAGEHPDIDTTLGFLIRYGLIERVSDIYVLFPKSQQSDDGESSLDLKGVAAELSSSQTEGSQLSFYQTSSMIDVIKIHSVVQGFCRDELKIMDKERQDKGFDVDKGDTGFYDSWLIVATRVLCKSYETAKGRMDYLQECGLVKDYREYETHASRLLEHFPKKISSPMVREARDDLKQAIKSIANEIDRISPSSSQESIRKHKSVFDRSSSSSSSVPESSADEGPSRQLTWDWHVSEPEVESPQDLLPPAPQRFNLGPFPPHIYRASTYEHDAGYETDGEDLKAVVRTSPALSQLSQSTEKPKSSQASSPPTASEDHEWHIVEKVAKPRLVKDRRPRKQRGSLRRFGGVKPVPALVEISSAQGRGSSSRNSDTFVDQPLTSTSEAEKALAAVQKSSPPPSHKENATPAAGLPLDKEPSQSYAAVAAKRLHELSSLSSTHSSPLPGQLKHPLPGRLQSKSSGESLQSRGSNLQPSPLTTEFRPDTMSQSTYSEPSHEHFAHHLNAPDLRSAPGSRFHSRHPSTARPLEPVKDLSASTPSVLPYLPSLPYEENIAITVSRRLGSAPMSVAAAHAASALSSITHPSALMPGTSPPSVAPDLLGGYASEPAPEPMSRNPSGQSHQSWSTEPVRYPPRLSPMPSKQGLPQSAMPNSVAHLVPQQQAISGTGTWAGDAHLASALQPVGASDLQTQPGLGSRNDPSWSVGYGPAPEPSQVLYYGGHRVDVRDARRRLDYGRLQAPRNVPYYYPSAAWSQETILPPHDGQGSRARSGSSPPHPSFDGLGVRFP